MSARRHNITIEQGATWAIGIRLRAYAPACPAQTSPLELTGHTARMQIRPHAKSDEILCELTTENGGILLDSPDPGHITLLLTAASTRALNFDYAVYDLELASGNTVWRLLQGKVKFSPEITR
jgi:hypothetical protein